MTRRSNLKGNHKMKFGRTEGTSTGAVLLVLFLLLLFAVGATMFVSQNEQKARVEAKSEELSELEAQAVAENEQTKLLSDKVGTDAFIEEIARDELGMVKPGEIIFHTDSD